MPAETSYIQAVLKLIEQIGRSQQEPVAEAATLLSDSLAQGGILHVFGPGHSHVVAEEAFNRTGGLACVNPIIDRTGGRAELVEGYARAILDAHDIRPGEVLLISSNSGVNPLPVEMALLAHEAGLKVVAITSLAFSKTLEPRHSSGLHLFEAADVVLDNGCPQGDALVDLPGVNVPVGAGSTIAAATLLNAVVVGAIERLAAAGVDPPVLLSERRPGEWEHNQQLKARYADRVRAQHTAMLFY